VAFQRFQLDGEGHLEEGEDYHTVVDPRRWIPPAVQELTGITSEDVRGKPCIEDVIHDVKKFIGLSYLVAHNAKFDKRFLDREFSRAGIPLVDDRRVIDSAESVPTGCDSANIIKVRIPTKCRTSHFDNIPWTSPGRCTGRRRSTI